jgi:hypothetical protein
MLLSKKLKTLLVLAFSLAAFEGFAQQLPLNTCGIVNVYDASGNRIKRMYFCNNGNDPYPARMKENLNTTIEFQQVDALYPNPTSGKFSISFSRGLNDAAVSVSNGNGKVVMQFKASGNKVDFDLSAVAAGVYFVRVQDGENNISKKVMKQ